MKPSICFNMSMGLRRGGRLLAAFLMVGAFLGCNGLADDLFCAEDGCQWNTREWSRISGLSPLPPVPEDPSNRYAKSSEAVSLGHDLYYDARLSGRATLQDTLKRPVQQARAPLGQLIGVSCATCHDPARGGGDHTSVPNNISVGAGWYDVNSQQTINAAHYPLLYWNGRSDSLWGQAAAVMESPVSMNGDRVAITRVILESYRAKYEAAFGAEYPLAPVPALPIGNEARARRELLRDPQSEAGPCKDPAPNCQAGCELKGPTPEKLDCYPSGLPLHGKPGRRAPERPQTVCTFAGSDPLDLNKPPTSEPFDDAFDCLTKDEQDQINRVFVNVAKAIGAYERKLASTDSPFDRFVAEGPSSTAISDDARRGLKLFVGKASCVDCHNGPMLSDGGFHNIGVPQTGPGVPTEVECKVPGFCDCTRADNAETCLPWGWEDGLAKLRSSLNPFRRNGPWADNTTMGMESHGRYYTMTADPTRRGSWRTPSLRDVAVTGPYMHNGIYRTLEEVVWHYDQGGETGEGGPKAPELKPLLLTARERSDLVAFLKTLTGRPPPVDEKYHRSPEVAMPGQPENPPSATGVAP
jgi:cytochrome c peroxidase